MYGDWLTTVALVVLLYRLTGSPTAPAGYILVRVAPRVLGVGPGGAFADRYSPVTVLVVCWLVQGALTAALVPISQAGSLTGLYLCVGVAQFFNAVSRPCDGAIIPRLGSRSDIATINRIYAAAESSSLFVVPLIGSALLLLVDVHALLLIDASTFFVGAAVIGSIKLRDREQDELSPSPTRGGRFAGLALAFADPVLRILLARSFAGAMVITALQAVLVVAAAERLGNADQVGLLYAAAGLGGVVGTAIVARWRPRSLSAGVLGGAGIVESVAIVLFALVPQIGAALFLLVISSIAGVLGETWGIIDLQERVPDVLLGRANAAVTSSLYAGMLVGAVLAIALTAAIRWQTTMVVVGGAALFVILLGLASTRTVPRSDLPGAS
jgi:hypothetical protein